MLVSNSLAEVYSEKIKPICTTTKIIPFQDIFFSHWIKEGYYSTNILTSLRFEKTKASNLPIFFFQKAPTNKTVNIVAIFA